MSITGLPPQPVLSATDARALTDRIKTGLDVMWSLVVQAHELRAHAALGYASWDDYCVREFGSSRIRIPREERAEVVASLRESGLSVRAIAAATGLGYGTVNREISAGDPNGSPEPVTGTDGKTYPATQPPRSITVIRDETGEEAGRIIDDRDIASMSDDEYDDMLADEGREQWEAEQDEIVPGFTADDIADMEVTPTPAPAEPAKPRRRPITEAFDSATFELKRAVERVARLAADDRLGKNKDQIQASNLSDLVRVRDAINGVINTLEG